ncbi:MAG: hypothetical protein JO356_14160, partial [Acidobacteria bacterium]|nr:hypothetical protein [Acidobacteriota bacterium]
MSLNVLRLMFLLAALALAQARDRPGGFTVLGPGGGGAMFHPTVSPLDQNTVLVACDMTGAYITHDGGNSWRLFNLRGVVGFFVFDPRDRNIVYAGTNVLWRSLDGGESWRLLYPKESAIESITMNPDHASETVMAEPDPLGTILALAVDPDDSQILYAAAGRDNRFLIYRSRDFGAQWEKLEPLPQAPRRIWIDPHSSRQTRTVWVSGTRYMAVVDKAGLHSLMTPAEFTDISLGFGQPGNPVIYATAEEGLLVSRDGGRSWHKSELPGTGAHLRAIATSFRHPETA